VFVDELTVGLIGPVAVPESIALVGLLSSD